MVPFSCFSALGAECTETLVETLDTTASIHNFLGTGVERMALGTYIQMNILAQGGLHLDYIAAGAASCNFFVLRMDIFLHRLSL